MIGPRPGLLDGGASQVLSFGPIATRAGLPDQINAVATARMQRFGSFALDDISALEIAWPNWYGQEITPNTNVMGITASIEYPAGNFTQLKFGGIAQGTAAPGTTLWSDKLVLPFQGGIPAGSKFWIRFYQTATTSYLSNAVALPDANMGDALALPGTDMTMGGTIVGNVNGLLTPCAIFGYTSKPNYITLGNSLNAGAGDSFQAVNGAYGVIAHAMSQYAYSNWGQSGKTAAQYVNAHALRDAIINRCGPLTTIVNALGLNDIFVDGTSSATLIGYQNQIRNLYPDKKFMITSLTPETTSTDSWATLANQTVKAQEAQRVAYNTAVRLNALGFTGAYDVAAVVESALNSGKWKVDGTAFKWTGDGTHPSDFAYNVFNTAGFVLL